MITYPCPGCKARLDVPSDAVGRPIDCPDCGVISTVPGPLEPIPEEIVEVDDDIRFYCPVCRKSYRTRSNQAGKKSKCGQCHTGLVIPLALSSEEIPAKLEHASTQRDAAQPVPAAPPRSLRQPIPSSPRSKSHQEEADEDDDDLRDARSAYRNRSARKRLLAKLSICLALAVVAFFSCRAAWNHVRSIRERQQQDAVETARAEEIKKQRRVDTAIPITPLPARQPQPAPREKPPIVVPYEPIKPEPARPKPVEPEPPPPAKVEKPAPPILEKPPAPLEPQPKPKIVPRDDGELQDQLAEITRKLKHKDAKVRLKAVEALEALGKKGAPSSKELCDALMDPNGPVATKALTALESVRPDLYKPLSTLLLDKSIYRRAEAVAKLEELGKDARPVSGLLVNSLKHSANENDYGQPDVVPASIFKAFKKIKPEDSGTIATMKGLASPETLALGHRYHALDFLVSWADDDEERRGELIPLIASGLDNSFLLISCINVAGKYGKLSKGMLPKLKQLKLSDTKEVREAAIAAVEKIEGK